MTSASPSYKNISSTQPAPTVGTLRLFDQQHSRPRTSPLDQFLSNTAAINVIFVPYLGQGMSMPRVLGALVVLGYMSAVESYFRSMIRGLINIDEHSRKLVGPRSLSYGAAVHHDVEMMPEALLEDISFASAEKLKEALKDLIGIKGQYPQDINNQFVEYKKVCEIRHCCVHRFGQLGTKNALSLGFEDHRQVIEKPFAPTATGIQDISDFLRTFVMTSNNFVFKTILERTAKNKDDKGQPIYGENWQWNYYKDYSRFKKYYDLFSTRSNSTPSAKHSAIYMDFRAQIKRS